MLLNTDTVLKKEDLEKQEKHNDDQEKQRGYLHEFFQLLFFVIVRHVTC